MNRSIRLLWIILLCVCGRAFAQQEIRATLVNPNATEEAQRVYTVLRNLYGQKSVSATVANVNRNIKEAQNVYKWTRKYPAMNVFDFIHIYASKDAVSGGWIDYSNTSVVSGWWKAGGLVGAMWHWNVPTNDGTGWTCTPGTGDDQTSFDPTKALDPSTEEYAHIIKDLDQVAGYLKKLQSLKIPVIWRPLHEAAGNTYDYSGGKAWFWWGIQGAETYKKLWQLMYDRFVNYHELNNLIWVWTSQVKDKDWYPGDEYVDIIGRDNYGFTASKAKSEFTKLQTTFPNHMIVLAECGHSGSNRVANVQEMWDKEAKWGWFMTWYDYDYNEGNTDTHRHTDADWWQAAWDSGNVVDRTEMKQLLKDAVGIEEMKDDERMKNEKWDAATYDLSGRRVANPKPGLILRNGKKIILK